MILNADGQKMSKRRDPVSVTDFDDMGILPEAMLNYLARLGWGHGDEEIFTLEQFVAWFDLSKISPSPSRFDMDKLRWTNAQHLKFMPATTLAERIRPRLITLLGTAAAKLDDPTAPPLNQVADLIRSRGQDLNTLAQECDYFYQIRPISNDDVAKHLNETTIDLMTKFRAQLATLSAFTPEAIHDLFKPFCTAEGIKMGQLGLPLRLLTCGTTQTPSIDATLALLGQSTTLARMDTSLAALTQ
jgi:glutamyl-tRNA synthetase